MQSAQQSAQQTDDLIADFWIYFLENAGKMNYTDLQKDSGRIAAASQDPMSHVFALTESGVIYATLIHRAAKIHPHILPEISIQVIPVQDHPLLVVKMDQKALQNTPGAEGVDPTKAKKCFVRFNLHLGARGDVTVFPLVERMYQIYHELSNRPITTDDWLVTRFVPGRDSKQASLYVHYKQFVIDHLIFKYRLHVIPSADPKKPGELDLVIVMQDRYADQMIQCQEDISLMHSAILDMIEQLVGEKILATVITHFTFLPARLHTQQYQLMDEHLRPLADILEDLNNMLPETKGCLICGMTDVNVDLKEFEDMEIEKGLYCPYCYATIKRLVS